MTILMNLLFLRPVLTLPNKIDSSALMFTSPKKKDMKHRRRLVDVERHEKRKLKRTTLKRVDRIQSEKNMDKVKPYGN